MYPQPYPPPAPQRSAAPLVIAVVFGFFTLAALMAVSLVVLGGNGGGDGEPAAQAPAGRPANGVLRVGVEIAPGTYRTDGPAIEGQQCYWARLRDFRGDPVESIIANGGSVGPITVTIQQDDRGFEARNCREWERIG